MFKRAGYKAKDLVTENADIALNAVQPQGGKAAAIASAFAILFSAISLYETVLKRANLHIYIPDTISYTRDPYGAYEVFILPASIVNTGAQDGIVTSLKLVVTNKQTGLKREFHSNYFVDGGYFSVKPDYTKGIKRPKNPFSPLAVAGRGNYSGTLLFYPKSFSKKRVLSDKGDYTLTVSMGTTPQKDLGFFDRLVAPKLKPLSLDMTLPTISRYFEGQMMTGNTVRLFRSGSVSPVEQKEVEAEKEQAD